MNRRRGGGTGEREPRSDAVPHEAKEQRAAQQMGSNTVMSSYGKLMAQPDGREQQLVDEHWEQHEVPVVRIERDVNGVRHRARVRMNAHSS